jgi:mono/diheme cytochrome c family protein
MKSSLKKAIPALIFFLLLAVGIFNVVNFGLSEHPGKAIYKKECANCHGDTGNGIRTLIPPLLDADYAITHFDSIPCWIKNGMSHEILVNGIVYEQSMYPIKLSEVEIANVMNYISKEFLKNGKTTTSTKVVELLKMCK